MSDIAMPASGVDSARTRSIVAGAVGNFVEFYDWTIYALMAAYFSGQYFPSADPTVSLLVAMLTFALSYIARPLGSLLFGAYSDRVGRRAALMISILGMAACSLIIGITPTYASIGVAAPIILVLARLLQGISAGGEGGSAQTYLVEFGRPGHRAIAGSWQQVSTGLSTLCALGTASLLTAYLSPEELGAWGWRVPFIIGAVLGLIGIYIRLKVEESPVFVADRATADQTPVLVALARSWQKVALVAAIALFPTVAFLGFQILLPTYMALTAGVSRGDSFNITLIAVACFVIVVPLAAMASDRFGRKPLMIGSTIAAILWAYPTFVGIPSVGNQFGTLVLITIVSNVILGTMAGGLVATMVEQFETGVRASGNGLGYAIGVILGGFFAPFLIDFARNKAFMDATIYVIVMAVISLIAFWMMQETKDKPLSRSGSV